MSEIYDRLLLYLSEKGLTKAQFSQKCGISPALFSQFERGRSRISNTTLDKICAAFPDIDRDWLRGEQFIDRLEKFMSYHSLNNNRLTVECGLTIGVVGNARKKRGALSESNIEKILSRYPELDRDWLLYGKGTSVYDSVTPDKVKTITVVKDPKKYQGDNPIKIFRKVNNIYQKDLSDYLGYNVASLSQIEGGSRRIPYWVVERLKDNEKGWDVSMLDDIDNLMGDPIRTGSIPRECLLDMILSGNLDMEFRLLYFSPEEMAFSLYFEIFDIFVPPGKFYPMVKTIVKNLGRDTPIDVLVKEFNDAKEEVLDRAEQFMKLHLSKKTKKTGRIR